VATLTGNVVAQLRVLGEPVHRIQPEAVDPPVQPEAQHLMHRGLDLGVVPVQVRLLRQK
jgi:hypothetical protein